MLGEEGRRMGGEGGRREGRGGINVQKQPFSDSVLLLHVAHIPEKNFIPKLSNCRSSKPESENGHFVHCSRVTKM